METFKKTTHKIISLYKINFLITVIVERIMEKYIRNGHSNC